MPFAMPSDVDARRRAKPARCSLPATLLCLASAIVMLPGQDADAHARACSISLAMGNGMMGVAAAVAHPPPPAVALQATMPEACPVVGAGIEATRRSC